MTTSATAIVPPTFTQEIDSTWITHRHINTASTPLSTTSSTPSTIATTSAFSKEFCSTGQVFLLGQSYHKN